MIEIEGAAVETRFLHPPALLAASYEGFFPDPGAYYTREFRETQMPSGGKCRKRPRRKKHQPYELNPKELLAEKRHQDVRSFLVESHKAFISNERAQEMLKTIANLCRSEAAPVDRKFDSVQLSQTYQAPLYELTFASRDESLVNPSQVFNNVVSCTDEQASCSGCEFVLPKHSRFFISDFSELHQLIPEDSSSGYNLLIIDPPWENKSVHRKSLYSTLPNKYLLSLPLQKLVHSDGALVGLWITNREKLHQFVERELFPAWGLVPAGTWFWLKIKPDGSMISELDSHHHRPYECLLLARVPEEGVEHDPSRRIFISVPGEHSRKPPLGCIHYSLACFSPFETLTTMRSPVLLQELAPGPKPVRALELFAREMHRGWTSWGNEPLCFQQRDYFCERDPD